jgi:hypothetical protein
MVLSTIQSFFISSRGQQTSCSHSLCQKMGIPNAKYGHYEIFNYIAIVLVGYGEIIALFPVHLKKHNSIQIITLKLKNCYINLTIKTQKVFMLFYDLTHTESVPNFFYHFLQVLLSCTAPSLVNWVVELRKYLKIC